MCGETRQHVHRLVASAVSAGASGGGGTQGGHRISTLSEEVGHHDIQSHRALSL